MIVRQRFVEKRWNETKTRWNELCGRLQIQKTSNRLHRSQNSEHFSLTVLQISRLFSAAAFFPCFHQLVFICHFIWLNQACFSISDQPLLVNFVIVIMLVNSLQRLMKVWFENFQWKRYLWWTVDEWQKCKEKLGQYSSVAVLALPRGAAFCVCVGLHRTCRPHDMKLITWYCTGGLPVAEPVANTLNADLGVIVVRKLGAPMNEECAIGAITASGVRLVWKMKAEYWVLS